MAFIRSPDAQATSSGGHIEHVNAYLPLSPSGACDALTPPRHPPQTSPRCTRAFSRPPVSNLYRLNYRIASLESNILGFEGSAARGDRTDTAGAASSASWGVAFDVAVVGFRLRVAV